MEKFFKHLVRIKEFSSVLGLLIVMFIFTLLSDKFLTTPNLMSIFTITSELGIMAIGVCLLMISGEFDLSVSSVFAIAPMVGVLLANAGVPLPIAFIVGLATCAAIGLFNGYIVLTTQIPSFIVTLGGMMFYRGILLAVTGGFSIIYQGDPGGFMNVLGGRTAFGLRASGVWFIALMIIVSIILNNTKYGNHVFAVGGNPGTAKAVGINVFKVKMLNFMICSMTAGLAGFMAFGRFRGVDPTSGTLMELEAIAASVIGGALLSGGYGSIIGAFIGAFLIGVMRSGLILAGAPAYWYRGFIGVVLVISVIINTKIRKAVAG